jgi:hypothetical protein
VAAHAVLGVSSEPGGTVVALDDLWGRRRGAAESGFADQSHRHRDVMAFTRMTPTAVASAPWLAVDDVAWRKPPSH